MSPGDRERLIKAAQAKGWKVSPLKTK